MSFAHCVCYLQFQMILILPMSQFLQLLSSLFSGSMSCCRHTSTGKVEGTSSQWLCWTFLLPYGLPFESGVREEMYPWDEQEKLLAALFIFSGFYHIVLLAANCNCQLKHWGNLFCSSGMSHMCLPAKQVHLCAFGDGSERKVIHTLKNWFCIMLWDVPLCTAQCGLFLTKCTHLSRFNLLCLDSVYLLSCALKLHQLIDMLKTTYGDPWSSHCF